MTIAVDVTYAVLANDISQILESEPILALKSPSTMSLSLRGTCIKVDRTVVIFNLIVRWWCWSIRADESGISIFCDGNSQSDQTF